MAKFEKGHKKLGGRKEGTPNRIRKGWAESVKDVLELNGPEMDAWVRRAAASNPLGAIQALATLAEFAAPKLSRVTHTGDANEPIFFKQVEDDVPADPGTGASN